MSTVRLTEGQDDSVVRVRAGDIVAIRLDEDPATGFRWDLERVDGPLRLVDERHEPGGGGAHVFSLQAHAPGWALATLKHWREWEGQRSITRRFLCVVEISDGAAGRSGTAVSTA